MLRKCTKNRQRSTTRTLRIKSKKTKQHNQKYERQHLQMRKILQFKTCAQYTYQKTTIEKYNITCLYGCQNSFKNIDDKQRKEQQT